MRYSKEPQYTAPIGPPSYDLATKIEPVKKKGRVGRWRERRREGKAKEGKEGKEDGTLKPPEYS